MENENGATQNVIGSAMPNIFPWVSMIQPGIVPTSVEPSTPNIAVPAMEPAKDIHAWQRTPEGKAKMSASIKAGWARRKARLASRLARAEREEESRTKESSIDTAIAYHLNAINTLRAAKALLK